MTPASTTILERCWMAIENNGQRRSNLRITVQDHPAPRNLDAKSF